MASENSAIYSVISAPPSRLRCSVTYRAYGARFSHLWRSVRYGCWPLVPNFPTELAIHLQRRMVGARSASPRAQAALAKPPITIYRV